MRIELKNHRTSNSKQYLNDNKTISVELFKENIHYLNNNQYEEIDNSLVDKANQLENKSNSFKVIIDKKTKIINISKDNSYINIYPKTDNDIKIEYEESKEKRLVEKFSFKNVYTNCDINYEIHPNQLKELLIINKKIEQEELRYIINTNLDIELTKNNTIEFKKNKKVAFEMEKPYMIDANNIVNESIIYSIDKNDKEYELIISLDSKWLNKKDRKYPVIIDPTITDRESTTNVIDTFIFNGDTNTTTYNLNYLKVGYENNIPYRTLLKFDLPTIPSSYKLVNAFLSLYAIADAYAPLIPSEQKMSIHRITESWTESGAKWSNMNDKYSTEIEDYNNYIRNNTTYSYDYVENIWDITRIVKDWYNDKYANYGILLKQQKEELVTGETPAFYVSKDANITALKPVIELVYKNYNGLENYLSYTTQNHHFGTSSISNYTGNLTTIFEVANTIGGELPASLSLVYNTYDIMLNNNYGYGLGIKPNLLQTIKTTTLENTPLEYLDEDGTKHYFYLNNDDNKYHDEDGLDLTIELSNNNYILEDKNGNKSIFVNHSNTYYLEEIKNTNNKSIMITYDSNNRITKVTDSTLNEINITYNTSTIEFAIPYKTTTITLTNNLITSISCLGFTETISYTNDNLLEYITNPDGTYLKYEYINNLINKVSKITEYSRNNTEGNYLLFTYNQTDTKVEDRKGFVNTYLFNDNGNVIGITNLDNTNNLSNAYGKSYSFGSLNNNVNKLINDKSLVKYVNNYINDSSFELEQDTFTYSSAVTKSYVSDARSGAKAIKFTINSSLGTPTINNTFNNITLDNNYFTYSTYIKGNGSINLKLTDGSTSINKTFNLTSEYQRISLTKKFNNPNVTSLTIKLSNITSTEIIIDDMQLEKSDVANYYNLIDNSNFNNGTTDWSITNVNTTTSIESVDSNTNALKIHSNPYGGCDVIKEFNISGHAGDTFNLSFWYKNNGIPATGFQMSMAPSMYAVLFFYYGDTEQGTGIPAKKLNIGNDNWQFFSENFSPTEDYYKLELRIVSDENANDSWFTNFSLFKDLESYSFTYDEKGNLVSAVDLNKEQNTMDYDKNNQLLNNLTPLGANYTYEYDNNVKNKLVRSISPTGITNEINYDSNGNPIKIRINNRKILDTITSGNSYYIRSKGTNRYIDINPDKSLKTVPDECSHDKFNIILLPNNQLKMQNTLLNSYYIKEINNSLQINYGDNNNTFELIENNNKSYSFRSTVSNKVITINSNTFTLSLDTYEEDNEYQEFYLEDPTKKLFIDSYATYTSDGRFINTITNELGYTITYIINTTNGLISSITDPNNTMTSYTYDNKLRVTNISKDNHSVSYTYDNNNNLSNIVHGTKNYQFVYDDFNNPLQVKINNTTLVSNTYEQYNGNITKTTYGNNNEVSYTYDEHDRIKTIVKSNDTYKNYYDNLGRISKISSTNNKYEFEYDFAKRISKYNHNNYNSTYEYNKENNIIEKVEKYNNISHEYDYIYNSESAITNIYLDSTNIEYTYDYLGRLTNTKMNNTYNMSYDYITTGRRTSTIINKVNDNNDIYTYEYDSLGSITKKYLNNNITNEYTYDIYNQLMEEKDHINDLKNTYTYDNYGNILTISKYNLTNNTLISNDTYTYNNSNWSDLLTNYNNTSITYDNIGNPLTIGNKTLTWMNGRELATYSDGTNNISFKYNERGIRTSKIVNNIETKYYLEGKNIIFEDRNGTVLYYIRNGEELLGFIYNNNTYYYHKNIFGDIIGIFDNNYNEIVKYTYDSWGNILNIIDTSNINLSTINPYRYRSYYYDNETNLYYLNSRYYNPLWKRFINVDNRLSPTGQLVEHNLFLYSNNNPIKYIDSKGESILFFLVVGGIGFGLGYYAVKNTYNKSQEAQKEINKVQEINSKKIKNMCLTPNIQFSEALKNNSQAVKEKIGDLELPNKLLEFRTLVGDNGIYNLKNKEEWKGKTIYYDNMWMTAEDAGNYHYGYIGRAANIPSSLLFMGAGANQLKNHKFETIGNCISASLCDDSRDSYFIRMGIDAYDKNNK